ncbi:MAG: hypothetical protein JWN03_7419 [Nocardia sp.]|nr:hypothetical protein [Nocardia sp.]
MMSHTLRQPRRSRDTGASRGRRQAGEIEGRGGMVPAVPSRPSCPDLQLLRTHYAISLRTRMCCGTSRPASYVDVRRGSLTRAQHAHGTEVEAHPSERQRGRFGPSGRLLGGTEVQPSGPARSLEHSRGGHRLQCAQNYPTTGNNRKTKILVCSLLNFEDKVVCASSNWVIVHPTFTVRVVLYEVQNRCRFLRNTRITAAHAD